MGNKSSNTTRPPNAVLGPRGHQAEITTPSATCHNPPQVSTVTGALGCSLSLDRDWGSSRVASKSISSVYKWVFQILG